MIVNKFIAVTDTEVNLAVSNSTELLRITFVLSFSNGHPFNLTTTIFIISCINTVNTHIINELCKCIVNELWIIY